MTPPIACPSDDLMLPFMTMSAALSVVGAASRAAAIAAPARIDRVLVMVSLLRRGRRDCLEIGDDGVNLRRREMMPETGHSRRAVADDLSHHVVLPAERLARERRPVERAGQLGLGVTDAARLIEQPH